MRRIAAAMILVTAALPAPAAPALAAPAVAAPAAPATFAAPAWEGRLAGLLKRPALVAGPPVVSGAAFSDTDGSPAEGDFALLAALELFRGERGPQGPARPGAVVTRAELTAVVVRMLGHESVAAWYQDKGAPPPYEDAGEIPAWARGYAHAASVLGLVRGLPGAGRGRFAAGEPVRFGDALTVVSRAVRRDGGDWPEEARQALDRALRARLGDAPAEELVTRERMAILVANALRAARYDARSGRLDPERSLLNTLFGVSEGVAEVDRTGTRLYLVSEEGTPLPPLDLAPQVFLRGAGSLQQLQEERRRVRAVTYLRKGGVVYIEAR